MRGPITAVVGAFHSDARGQRSIRPAGREMMVLDASCDGTVVGEALGLVRACAGITRNRHDLLVALLPRPVLFPVTLDDRNTDLVVNTSAADSELLTIGRYRTVFYLYLTGPCCRSWLALDDLELEW